MNKILAMAIFRDLKRIIIAPERVIKLRLYLYDKKQEQDYLWSNTHYTIKELIDKNIIKKHKGMIYCKDIEDKYDMSFIENLWNKKQIINKRWIEQATRRTFT